MQVESPNGLVHLIFTSEIKYIDGIDKGSWQRVVSEKCIKKCSIFKNFDVTFVSKTAPEESYVQGFKELAVLEAFRSFVENLPYCPFANC